MAHALELYFDANADAAVREIWRAIDSPLIDAAARPHISLAVAESCDTAWQCENDAQQYQGGNVVCCTGKNLCFTCTRMVNGREQTYSVWQYNGVENRSCVLNP